MKLRLTILFFALFLFSIFLVNSDEAKGGYELDKGKNLVNFSGIVPFYVHDLVELNPEIEVVSFEDSEGRSIGFVNVYGGVGSRFAVRDGIYEISVSEDTTLILPNNY